jgi:hypothetical protein
LLLIFLIKKTQLQLQELAKVLRCSLNTKETAPARVILPGKRPAAAAQEPDERGVERAERGHGQYAAEAPVADGLEHGAACLAGTDDALARGRRRQGPDQWAEDPVWKCGLRSRSCREDIVVSNLTHLFLIVWVRFI